jgi:hypothetical protein
LTNVCGPGNVSFNVKTSILSPASHTDCQKNSPQLLLLFGTPRSGTTWLGKIFDSHPLTLYKHEPDRSRFGVPFAAHADLAEQWREQVLAFVAKLNSINTAHTSARLPVFKKKYRSHFAQTMHRLSVLGSGALSNLGWQWPVWQFTDIHRPDVRVVWKSTDSLARLGAILRVLENCRAVRIIRHPCGYVASVLRGEKLHRFVASVTTSEDYGIMQKLLDAGGSHTYGLTIDHMRRFHRVERMAWIWVLLNEKAERDTADDPRCMSVRYEDVCRAPIDQARFLFSFCGLDWDSQTVDFIQASTGSSEAGRREITTDARRYYSIFHDPRQAAEKWRSEMKVEDIERVYKVLRQTDLIRLYPEEEPALQAESHLTG